MKTKAQIVQELLEKKAITTEEAVTLLQPESVIYSFPVYPYVPPYNPYPYPYTQIWQIPGPTS